MKMIDPNKLKTHELFSNLFSIDPEVLKAIADNMAVNGFDPSQPIVIWKEEQVILDGHTRDQAAINQKIKEVPVIELSFKTAEAALAYAVMRQRDRRQWSNAQIYHLISAVDHKEPCGRKPKNVSGSGNIKIDTAAETANLVGVGRTMVTQVRGINDHGDEEMIRAIKCGELSINAAYEEVQNRKKAEKGKRKKKKRERGDKGEKDEDTPVLRKTVEACEWAPWTWAPLADYGSGPELVPSEFMAPVNTPIPTSNFPCARNVLVSPDIDLFGNAVRQELIGQVLKVVEENSRWNFIFVTKNPGRIVDFQFPENCSIGVRVNHKDEVQPAISALWGISAKVNNPALCLFIEFMAWRGPLSLRTGDFAPVQWVIIDAKKDSSDTTEAQPEWGWVERIIHFARKDECMVYLTPNITVRPREFPLSFNGGAR